jgi:hypothetical protein
MDNIWYVLLVSAQDQNDSIVGKYEIISTRIGKLCLEVISYLINRNNSIVGSKGPYLGKVP